MPDKDLSRGFRFTAAELAREIFWHLYNQPVQARRPSAIYRI